MERALTADEKIRRAEEIYQRRRMNETRKTTARVNVADTQKDCILFKKMILQIMVCLCIYFAFFLIKNGNYIFSEEFIKQAKEILSYDLNLQEQYKNITSFFEQNNEQVTDITPQEEAPAEETNIEENNEKQTQNADEAIGGAEATDTLSANEELIEESSSISQTKTDAEEVLQKYSLIKPLSRNNNLKVWCAQPNNRNSTKIPHRNRHCSRHRHKICSSNGRQSSFSIKPRRLPVTT